MKLEERIKKLKQLDRIEYRQKLNYIDEKGFSIINLFFFIFILFSVFFVGAILSQDSNLAAVSLDLIAMSLIVLVLDIIIGLIYYFLKSYLREKLQEEYFKIEVKK